VLTDEVPELHCPLCGDLMYLRGGNQAWRFRCPACESTWRPTDAGQLSRAIAGRQAETASR
jgi:transposase-like protein